jgi:hypothetical protein
MFKSRWSHCGQLRAMQEMIRKQINSEKLFNDR